LWFSSFSVSTPFVGNGTPTSRLATVPIRWKDSAIRLDGGRPLAAGPPHADIPTLSDGGPRDESGGIGRLRREAVSIG
jgi:hypothetical protein